MSELKAIYMAPLDVGPLQPHIDGILAYAGNRRWVATWCAWGGAVRTDVSDPLGALLMTPPETERWLNWRAETGIAGYERMAGRHWLEETGGQGEEKPAKWVGLVDRKEMRLMVLEVNLYGLWLARYGQAQVRREVA